MKTNLKIFYGLSIFAIIAVANIAHAATTSVVNNKTSQFNDVLSEMGANATDSSNAALAETIRRQRALLDAAGDGGATTTGGTNITTANACDAALRKCMSEKCGADFTKCASDSTTVWGNKMDSCRRNTKCTGHEYTLLAPEILADRNAAIELSYYNSVVNCGNRYNNCVFGICGKSLENCLSKSAGDSAIAKCKSIADECREQDSGLAARMMGVFGDRRNIAATEAQRDEKRLYELRDLMRTQCTRFGAMFDERTLDCVYTVNFFAGTDNTLMASKKLYSGDTFQCTPDWFGVDITTYMENAARLTRSQTSASAAAMGAGLGTAASLWTSGAVMRGIDTQNAEKQAKEACTAVDGEWVSAGFNQGSKCDMRKPKAKCEGNGGTWDDKTGCSGGNNNGTSNNGVNNPTSTGNKPYDTLTNILNKNQDLSNTIATAANCIQYNNNQTECEKADGCIWGAPNKERPDSKGCIAKIDSSTGGGRKPTNSDTDKQCNTICSNAIQELTDKINDFVTKTPIPTRKNPFVTVENECANTCKSNAQTACNKLINQKATSSSDELKIIDKAFLHANTDGQLFCAFTYREPETNQSGNTIKDNLSNTTRSIQDIKQTMNQNVTQTCNIYCETFARKLKPNVWTNLEKITCKSTCKPLIDAKCKTFENQSTVSTTKENCNNDNSSCNYICETKSKNDSFDIRDPFADKLRGL